MRSTAKCNAQDYSPCHDNEIAAISLEPQWLGSCQNQTNCIAQKMAHWILYFQRLRETGHQVYRKLLNQSWIVLLFQNHVIAYDIRQYVEAGNGNTQLGITASITTGFQACIWKFCSYDHYTADYLRLTSKQVIHIGYPLLMFPKPMSMCVAFGNSNNWEIIAIAKYSKFLEHQALI